MEEERSIWITTGFVGWHAWEGAPPRRDYLGSLHRHRFGVRVELLVDHDDREVEFHDLIDATQQAVGRLGTPSRDGRMLGGMSCEMVAERLAQDLREQYDYTRPVSVEVDEDGEAGARVMLPSR